MSAKDIAVSVSDTLRSQGVEVNIKVRDGTWTVPGSFEFDYGGQHHVIQFWAGSHSDKFLAAHIYDGVLGLIDPQAQR